MVRVSHLSRVFNRVGGVAPRDLKITTLFLITGAREDGTPSKIWLFIQCTHKGPMSCHISSRHEYISKSTLALGFPRKIKKTIIVCLLGSPWVHTAADSQVVLILESLKMRERHQNTAVDISNRTKN